MNLFFHHSTVPLQTKPHLHVTSSRHHHHLSAIPPQCQTPYHKTAPLKLSSILNLQTAPRGLRFHHFITRLAFHYTSPKPATIASPFRQLPFPIPSSTTTMMHTSVAPTTHHPPP